jgi:hypothetical protein
MELFSITQLKVDALGQFYDTGRQQIWNLHTITSPNTNYTDPVLLTKLPIHFGPILMLLALTQIILN